MSAEHLVYDFGTDSLRAATWRDIELALCVAQYYGALREGLKKIVAQDDISATDIQQLMDRVDEKRKDRVRDIGLRGKQKLLFEGDKRE